MPWTGPTFIRHNEDYSGASVWQSDAAASILIQSVRHDYHDYDLAQGIDACLNKNGANTATANIGMGGFKFTNLANGSGAADSAAYGQTITAASLNAGTNLLTLTRAAGNVTVDLTPLVVGGSTADFAKLSAGNNAFLGSATWQGTLSALYALSLVDQVTISGAATWSMSAVTPTAFSIGNVAGASFTIIGNSGTAYLAINSNKVWDYSTLLPATVAGILTTTSNPAITGSWNFNGGSVILPTATTFGGTGTAWSTNISATSFQLFAVSSSALMKCDYDVTEGTRLYAGSARVWTNNNLRTSLVVAPTGGVSGDLACVPTGAQRGLWQNLAGTWTKLIAFP